MIGMTGKVIPLDLTPNRALTIIREIAADSSRVAILEHAKGQMRRRKITRGQAISCRRLGIISEGPGVNVKGFWRCRLERLAAGQEISVVTSFNSRERLIVITAF